MGIAALMLLPGASVLGAAHAPVSIAPAKAPASIAATAKTASAAPSYSNPAQASIARMKASLTADHIPAQEQLLPSMNPGVVVQNGLLSPGSPEAPEPMGIADYGIQDVHGKNVGTISYTPSLQGTLTVNKLNLMYLDSYGPDEYTAQLNSVAVAVTLQDSSVYQFWTQNVFYYYQSDHTIHMADAIVNFSSPAFNVPYGALLTGNGYLAPGFGYFYPTGPTVYAPEPFTISFYSNLSVVDNHPTVTFAYSVTSSAGTSAGTYDQVEFNSTVAVATAPTYQINGVAYGDTGYIPNDVELDLCGDGGGSTANVLNINATMNLYIQHNGTHWYYPVPSAYDFGGETGETVDGVAEWASGGPDPTVHLGPGPDLQTPLWGVAGAPRFGDTNVTLDVTPANAFVFGSIGGSFNASAADWAYVPPSGVASYLLPPGQYSFQVLLSNYDPQTLNWVWGGTHTVTLVPDATTGMYTPLWANSNAELAAISYAGGTGTVHNPYVLFGGPTTELLNPLFGQVNDYGFPVFDGILLVGTTDYTTIAEEGPFEVADTLASDLFFLSPYLPLDNELGWGFYAVSHTSIVDNSVIGGWLDVYIYGGADLVMWNSTDNLLAANTFQDSGLGIFDYDGSGNTIWGNVFTTSLPIAPDPYVILGYGDPVAMELFESGDLIYNNYIGTPQTAFTPPYNVYDFYYVPVLWHDTWNVKVQPATDVRVVNGWELSGNILGLSYEGGNYWSNYGTQTDPFGVLPYDNGGNIVVGGDKAPLEPFALYEVTFKETGLPSGTQWNVTLNGIEESATGSTINFWDPSGLYAFAVTSPSSYTPSPSIGAVQVVSSAQTVSISWT